MDIMVQWKMAIFEKGTIGDTAIFHWTMIVGGGVCALPKTNMESEAMMVSPQVFFESARRNKLIFRWGKTRYCMFCEKGVYCFCYIGKIVSLRQAPSFAPAPK